MQSLLNHQYYLLRWWNRYPHLSATLNSQGFGFAAVICFVTLLVIAFGIFVMIDKDVKKKSVFVCYSVCVIVLAVCCTVSIGFPKCYIARSKGAQIKANITKIKRARQSIPELRKVRNQDNRKYEYFMNRADNNLKKEDHANRFKKGYRHASEELYYDQHISRHLHRFNDINLSYPSFFY